MLASSRILKAIDAIIIQLWNNLDRQQSVCKIQTTLYENFFFFFCNIKENNVEVITSISCCGRGADRYDVFCWCNNVCGVGRHKTAAVWG